MDPIIFGSLTVTPVTPGSLPATPATDEPQIVSAQNDLTVQSVAGDLIFKTGGTERARIADDGTGTGLFGAQSGLPASPSTGDAVVWNGTAWVAALIANANIDAAAAITSAKLASYPDAFLPWLIDIDVFPAAVSQTNWDTVGVDTAAIYNGSKNSSGAQNDEINFDVLLAAGTWTVGLIHTKGALRGIYSVQFDGVEKATIDGYAASTTENARSAASGITIASSGKSRLKLKMATKNASSSGYLGSIQHIQLIRTA